MEDITPFLDWLKSFPYWGEFMTWVFIALGAVKVIELVINLTPSKKDDEVFNKVKPYVDIISSGVNFVKGKKK